MTNKQKALTIKNNPSRQEAQEWFSNLIKTWNILVHPDDFGACYVNREGQRTFSDKEAECFDRSINKVFCKFGNDTYKICLEAYHQWEKETGIK